MARKRGVDYFELLKEQIAYSRKAAEKLESCMPDFPNLKLSECIQEMHVIEHSADQTKHRLMDCLMREFLPPLDREDIFLLSSQIDDVTDHIEDVLLRLYMFNVHRLRPEIHEFVALISKCTAALVEGMAQLHDFRKSQILREKIIEVNTLEGQGDKLYERAIRHLYTDDSDAVEKIVWTEIFDRLEKCCDACEHTVDVLSRVIMSNT